MKQLVLRCWLLVSFTTLLTNSFAQDSKGRIASFNRVLADTSNILNSISFTNLGPSIMSGRVTDIEVNPVNPTEFYVAYASGGVWHTTNNGLSMTPIFDDQASITIGDILMNWQEGTLYVGTGECNSSRSSYAGTGVYVSKDTGRHWRVLPGTENTEHIAELYLLENKNLLIASIGSLFSDNKNNGGLYIYDSKTDIAQRVSIPNCPYGFIDIQADPKNKNVLYAASWERTRRPWQFTGEGKGSAIYKSTDAGKTWQCISGGSSGFPQNEGIGRIGLAVAYNNNNIVYALVDNQNRQTEVKKKPKLSALEIKDMSTEAFLKLDEKKLNAYLRDNNYPGKYTAKSVKQDIKDKKYLVKDVADWLLSDRNYSLFETPIIGGELYRSNDGGKTWLKTHDKEITNLFFTYGYYFGTVAVSPANDNEVYVAGFSLLRSTNGGKKFSNIMRENCHPDYHEIWINPNNPAHLIAGNDGGVNISYDTGTTWMLCNSPAVGQFYSVQVDNAVPYNIYGGLQDNGTWVVKRTASDDRSWQYSGKNAYTNIGGGDGMQVQVDTRTNNTVYMGYQFGLYQRCDRNGKYELSIHPTHDIGEEPLRYNWQTPILLSKHQQDILYMGSNKFMRSFNKGADMEPISKDLTSTTKSGNVPFGTITCISESPKRFGLIYVGTDDGNIWVSNNNGYDFTQINSPAVGKWVTRIVASKYNENLVYVTHSGHTQDDFKAYIYCSHNQGKTWEYIGHNLPNEPINVMREDPNDKNIIYVGTDNGLYVSFDSNSSNRTFIRWSAGLPRVAIHDIAIQEREQEIVLGTHGRSIYVASIKELKQLDSLKKIGFTILHVDTITVNTKWGQLENALTDTIKPEINIQYFSPVNGTYSYTITTTKGKLQASGTINARSGYNTFTYDGRLSANNKQDKNKFLMAGTYNLTLTGQGKQKSAILYIKENKESDS